MRIPEEKNLTRVTEYMTEIIEYIERIMENGFAYTKAAGSSSDNRSVYFDTQSYMCAPSMQDVSYLQANATLSHCLAFLNKSLATICR